MSACTSPPPVVDRPVDIDRFMGDWYVVAGKFTFLERGAHNAVEHYERKADGTIATTFTFRKGAFDGPLKTYRPTGFVEDEEKGAEWRMQFLWPFKAAYLILYLDDDYEHTAIGVPSRRYLWIMARKPVIAEDVMEDMLARLREVGYELDDLTYIPHRWDDPDPELTP